jgi:hypothetical protein
MSGKQIQTYGTNYSQEAFYTLNSRGVYICANSTITRGVCGPPTSLENCFDTYSSIKVIAEQLGFLNSGASGSCGGNSGYNYNLWKGATVPQTNLLNTFQPIDVYLNDPSTECDQVNLHPDLGASWLGCLWGTPDASYSCTCPEIGQFYEAYLKLRLNVATFWNTPKNTPVKRAEFIDSIKYGRKINITVAGDFNLKLGQVVQINVDGISGFPYASYESSLNGLYYITGIKHVITNSGTHESALELTQVPAITTVSNAGSTYAVNYP